MTDAHYTTRNFPIFVVAHGNWDIYRNTKGYCVSIPTPAASAKGCKVSHFGDAGYARVALGVTIVPEA